MTLDNNLIDELSGNEEKVHGKSRMSKKEGVLAIILLGFFLLANFVYSDVFLLILSGMAFAIWLVFRASHLAIDGLESLGAYVGLSAYIIGVLSSLASNTPEAVVSALTAIRGYTTGSPELVEIAVLSVVMAAGFNILLLGFVVILSSRKTGSIDMPEEVVEDDADLIRWTIVAMAILLIFGIIQYIRAIETATPTTQIVLPQLAGLTMVFSYVLYAIYALKKKPKYPRPKVTPLHSRKKSTILAILGFAGIFIAGYILTGTIEIIFEYVPWTSYGIAPFQQIVVISMIIGAAGAIPEHSIAFLAAAKGKASIAIGNTLGGTTQVLLLIIGGVSLFLPLPLDARVLLQLATAAGSLWFLLRAMTDDRRIDIYEGAMILLLQVFVFIIILTPLVGAS